MPDITLTEGRKGMYYPDEVIEEVRMKNDIVDVISGYVKLQKKGANYFGLCLSIMKNHLPFRFSGKTDVLLFRLRSWGKCSYLCNGI